MEHAESCSPPLRSSSHHSHVSSRNSSSIKESSSFPTRRLTLDTSQINTLSSSEYSPRQSLLQILNEKGIVSVPQIETTLPIVRKYIQQTTEKLLSEIELFIKLVNQIIALYATLQKDEGTLKTMNEETLMSINKISIQGLSVDSSYNQTEFKNVLDNITGLYEVINSCYQLIQNNINNLFCPIVVYLNTNGVDKLLKFIQEILNIELLIKKMNKNSLICKKICEENENNSLEDVFIKIISIINVYIPLFESDRQDIQRKIEVQEILIQFKGTSSSQSITNGSISLSDLLWAKSNLKTSIVFSSQLLRSIECLESFLIHHDILNIFKAACQYNPSVEIWNPLFEQLTEDSILHAGIAFLKLQTNDGICRYQKCYLFYTTIGLFLLFAYTGNILIPCDFISSKRLINADIEILLPQDNAFAADLHIITKDSNYRKEFYFAIQHDSEVIEWSSLLKETLSLLDTTTLSNFEFSNCIATKITNRKLVTKKNKYVGSSIEELVQLQQLNSCLDTVPDVLNKCINEIINKGLTEDGLFRKPPDQYQLEELMKKLNDNDFRSKIKLKEYPIGTICGLLKSILMEMNPRFINGESYKLFVDISRKKDREEMRKQIILFIDSLNIEHRNTLGRYLFLMNIIAINKRLNRMGESNLSTAICQCFLPQKDNVDLASVENDSFECLINNYDLFLPKKIDNPIQIGSLTGIIKKQITMEGVGSLLFIPQINEMWSIDKIGNVVQINTNTLQSNISKINISLPDIKHIGTYKNYIYLGTTSTVHMIDIETKQIVKNLETKRCSFITISNEILFIGEQNGIIEVYNPLTLDKINEITIKIDNNSLITPITLIALSHGNIYASLQGKNEIYVISYSTGKLLKTFSTFHHNSIVCLTICEENQTLWTGDYNGMVCVLDLETGILLQKYDHPLTYGSVMSIMVIPKYIIISFISSQILIFNNENNTLVTSLSTKYLITSKVAYIVQRNYNGKLMWNIWMEKDDNGDIAIMDITYPVEDIPTDERLVSSFSYLENEYIEKTPLGHCFLSINCEAKCCVCSGVIKNTEESFKCSNCNKYIHQRCLEKFSNTFCSIHSQLQPEIINKSK
ncbi:RhoGAP domain containing protein [Entamoeba histolytica HM-1:IMSS-B]|uniref:RhoGAP domain containing protein n=6 Tax=Entamoeba histolytica TaxID=5759 RepID=C4LTP1_ENTH1|nr:RhoGAP domain containing protein [Entamoeba histolytica HM-1:IMSS]EMH72070.1 RhoGAP domain containing protein [Entamoeba histolytica HM-1:IMSS-B]EMS16015.1 RhoGAP domain containing protein [Entamoeba histolytica HM-3:IMSS]ENY65892.1 RhoGAP domain containing protein [Entamoeba histolytica HM-1:IMSS-A]GAT91941.1 rhogap domain containing protein [Entamoeba histolytica]EAL49939.1 RhoGAP domain containing protein [Entamoeba histolytica HM-1:IMSS]|eukprot:XP_655325.1 RhoGAP domain containing protein [Entamoeba histolytica HM-1:IMSS]